ncbi:hypothetical protein AVEN_128719-1 [Araneus ventricosus]|uniref:Uncharacterized protein n=1 Tax=Araneus ventricosus TaxID=182803 RepID=A0A4Y2X6S8_ARAVE|nr:hypothetical protein AVEN_6620-1 [Araneus ventricosus]GBO44625.1 hypothetical protein AVEN_257576-1 [Araneus ventricosus]GBO44626.1 hypothetical protein AVEN_17765-1 [Araneus ventricosus]GBO44627.1 hypothetical protein AVEN_128719-1 [Araneus ventricosus]
MEISAVGGPIILANHSPFPCALWTGYSGGGVAGTIPIQVGRVQLMSFVPKNPQFLRDHKKKVASSSYNETCWSAAHLSPRNFCESARSNLENKAYSYPGQAMINHFLVGVPINPYFVAKVAKSDAKVRSPDVAAAVIPYSLL